MEAPKRLPLCTLQVQRHLGLQKYLMGSAATPLENIYNASGTLNSNRIVTMDDNFLQFRGNGNVGIGTTSPPLQKLHVVGNGLITENLGIGVSDPLQKLDVNGNARFRDVPSESLADTDQYLGITSNGTLKKVNIGLPALAFYAISTQSNLRNADNVARGFAIDDTHKINSDYIERVNSYTFKAKKYGLYTVEVWGELF